MYPKINPVKSNITEILFLASQLRGSRDDVINVCCQNFAKFSSVYEYFVSLFGGLLSKNYVVSYENSLTLDSGL